MNNRIIKNHCKEITHIIESGNALNIYFSKELKSLAVMSHTHRCNRINIIENTISLFLYDTSHSKNRAIIFQSESTVFVVELDAERIVVRYLRSEDMCLFQFPLICQISSQNLKNIGIHKVDPDHNTKVILLYNTRFYMHKEDFYIYDRNIMTKHTNSLGAGTFSALVRDELYSLTYQENFFHLSASLNRRAIVR